MRPHRVRAAPPFPASHGPPHGPGRLGRAGAGTQGDPAFPV